MASLTIRNVDEDVKQALRLRAARKGVSVESEMRDILRSVASEEASFHETDAQREDRLKRILALGRKPDEPFDQKQATDELWDFMD